MLHQWLYKQDICNNHNIRNSLYPAVKAIFLNFVQIFFFLIFQYQKANKRMSQETKDVEISSNPWINK